MSSASVPARSARFGLRPFLSPALDYLLIGGGLSLLTLPLYVSGDGPLRGILFASLPWLLLFGNGAHFASSTVRLYMKPGAREALPFLTMGLPLLALAILLAGLAFPGSVGSGLVKLYFTWSPYHYAAQAYGIAVVYAFRSGVTPASRAKKLLWWSAMLPFFYSFLGHREIGLDWLLPEAFLGLPAVSATVDALVVILRPASFVVPAGLAAWLLLSRKPLPAISLLVILVNATWWILLPFWEAFVWATVFHGIQYLALVTAFHVRDRSAREGDSRSPAFHAVTFYAACVALGWLLFQVMPEAGMALGFGAVESVLVVVAAINIHHFIVDAYIWRLKPGDTNRKIVEATQDAASSAVPGAT